MKRIYALSTGGISLAVAALLFLGNANGALAAGNFTRDLTLGASGADVSALQVFLAGQGYQIPAGATGYFGAQTKAALASYQAAHGIMPAAGYFGALTRASINASPAPSTGSQGAGANTGATSNTGTGTVLSGGEATIRNYKLVHEESNGHEGDQDVQIATVKFDVKNGDIRVERLELTAAAANSSLNMQPWRYFDTIKVEDNGKTLASESVDSRSDWDEVSTGVYRVTLSNLSDVIRKNKTAELTIVADISDSIDTANQSQTFTFSVDHNGLRAVDASGIQQYVGNDSATTRFGFDSEENGDLSIRSDSSDPDSQILVTKSKESSAYTVFAFDLQNKDSVDSLLTDLTIRITDLAEGVSATDVLRHAYLKVDGKKYEGDIASDHITFKKMKATIDGDSDATALLSVTLAKNATSTPIGFSVASADLDAEGVRSGDNAHVSGSQTGNVHMIAPSGIQLGSASVTQEAHMLTGSPSASYGTYTFKFNVTATDDDAYIPMTIGTEGPAGFVYSLSTGAAATTTATITSSASKNDGYFRIPEGQTKSFTILVTVDPEVSGFYGVELNSISFNKAATTDGSTVYQFANNGSYTADPVYIPS